MRAEVGVERADVFPVARCDRADEGLPVSEQPGKHIAREVDLLVAIDVLEDLGVEHVDAGVDRVAEDLSPGRLLEESLDRPVFAGDDDAELEGVLDVREPDRRHRFVLVVEGEDGAEVDVGEHVARDHRGSARRAALGRCRPSPRCRAACSRWRRSSSRRIRSRPRSTSGSPERGRRLSRRCRRTRACAAARRCAPSSAGWPRAASASACSR